MRPFRDHLILTKTPIKAALVKLNVLGKDAILFVTNELDQIIGSLTDGDVRRGLINGVNIEDLVDNIIQPNPKYIKKDNYDVNDLIIYRRQNYRILPVVNNDNQIVDVVNFDELKSYLPIDAVIMAGGRGERLRPLTDSLPKPLLKVGEKPIMEHNLDRIAKYGIQNFWVSVRYLGSKIEEYFGDGNQKNVNIEYVHENEPLGTIGALSKIKNFSNEYILLTNSDLLTDLDYEDFFLDFIKFDADLAIVTIPYKVDIPYAVLETEDNRIKSFKEKPTYTYYSNGGIYLMKKSVLKYLPENTAFDATDLMAKIIQENLKVVSFPLSSYWLDVGKHEDFAKAQEDIKHLKF